MRAGWRVCGEPGPHTSLIQKPPFWLRSSATWITTTSPRPPSRSSSIPHLLAPSIARPLTSSTAAASLTSPAAMAMAMGVASMAVTAPRNASLVCRAAETNPRGEKGGFLDWFRNALDKESLSETDDVLAKVDGGKSNDKAVPTGKKALNLPLPPLKKAGFNLFGKK